MESETQETNVSPDGLSSTDSASSLDSVSSSDSLTATSPPTGKKKGKKKDSGSDVAFFACFPCMVIAAAAVVLTLVGFLPIGWFAEFCASLRAQLILVLLLCALPALFAPQLRVPMVVACGLFAVINLIFVVPCMFPKGEPTGEKKNLQYLKFRIMQLSIEDQATKLEPILEEITRVHPEIVCVTGIPSKTLLKLNEQMPSQFIHRSSFNRDDGYGLAIYSTVPLKGTRLRKVGPEKLPIVLTTVHFDYGWFRIILLKVPDATDNESLEKRNEQLKATAKVVHDLKGRNIVVGNFNTTPYSMAFGDFLKEADLQDTRVGVMPNYNIGPVDFMGLLHVPVDHMLVNKHVAVLHRYVCQPAGLTHRPLLGDFYPADTEIIKYSDGDSDAGGEAPAAAPTPAATEQPAAADDKKPAKPRRRRK